MLSNSWIEKSKKWKAILLVQSLESTSSIQLNLITIYYPPRVYNSNKKTKIIYTSETSGVLFILSVYRLGTSYNGGID